MHGTVCEALAANALAAYIELSELYQFTEIQHDSDVPILREFLRSTAGARIQHPERMKKIDSLFDKEAGFQLINAESDLSHLLKEGGLAFRTEQEFKNFSGMLWNIAAALFEIHRDTFQKAQSAYEKAIAI